ncbi:lariat debranching enzyme isoform X2 [Venturia canescens]|nr:lariat debranching enzyme isoform X2 [Venturia canescens]
MAVPDKYKDMCSFYKYYSGEKIAPILTIFIGGNHEASNYLQELPYGGWVAPNIYYMGYASVITVAGIRIAGISGIYKSQDWMQGHHEKTPYDNSTIRSVYHIRNLEVFRLKQLSGKIDIFLSHDWPRGITQYGDEQALLRNKPFFKNDIEANVLGSPPCMDLLSHHNPSFWFSAHLHCKFAAVIPKEEDSSRITKFLALDKCLPKRKFLQVLELDHDENLPIKINYDHEWLTILYLTNHLLSVTRGVHYMPGQGGNGRWMYTPTESEKASVSKKFQDDFAVPENFVKTAEAFNPEAAQGPIEPPRLCTNPQTTLLCDKLGIDDPSALLKIMSNTKEDSFSNSAVDKTLDSRETSLNFEDSVMNSTMDEDSLEESSDRASPLPPLSPENHVEIEDYPASKNLDSLFTEKKETDESLLELSDVDAVIDKCGEKSNTEPNCKKFKRRNHSLYSDTT